MTNDANDLERYRRDEMTPAERHVFEKRALEDPFLRDALSGSESITPKMFSEDVSDLNRRLVQHRAPWFTPIRIAAGIAIIATVGWLVYQTTPSEPESLAEMKSDSTAITDSTSKLLTLAAPPEDSTGETDKKDAVKSIAEAPAVKPSESQPTSTQPAPTSTAGQSASGAIAKTEPAKADAKTEPAQAEAVKTELAKEEVAEDAQRDKALRAAEPAPSASQKRAVVAPQTASGTVREAEQGLPLAGDDSVRKSNVIVITNDSLLADKRRGRAAPVGGVNAYQRYLETNQRIPAAARAAGIHGEVEVYFDVTSSGNLSGFRITKSLGFGCDEELLRLIRSGPAWSAGVLDNKPVASQVWVKLEFAADR